MQAARREAEEALDSVTMPDPEQEPLLSSGRMSRWAAARAASPLRLRMRKGPLVVLRGKRGGEAGRQRCACVGAERDRTPAEQRRRASSPAALGRQAGCRRCCPVCCPSRGTTAAPAVSPRCRADRVTMAPWHCRRDSEPDMLQRLSHDAQPANMLQRLSGEGVAGGVAGLGAGLGRARRSRRAGRQHRLPMCLALPPPPLDMTLVGGVPPSCPTFCLPATHLPACPSSHLPQACPSHPAGDSRMRSSYDADYTNYHKAPQQLPPQVGRAAGVD